MPDTNPLNRFNYELFNEFDTALKAIDTGWRLIPCLTYKGIDNSKKIIPCVKTWENSSLDDIEALIDGGVSNSLLGLHDEFLIIDFNSQKSIEFAVKELPMPMLKTKAGWGEHWYYKYKTHFTIKGDVNKSIELEGINIQIGNKKKGVLVPGSWHPLLEDHYKVLFINTSGETTNTIIDIHLKNEFIKTLKEAFPFNPDASASKSRVWTATNWNKEIFKNVKREHINKLTSTQFSSFLKKVGIDLRYNELSYKTEYQLNKSDWQPLDKLTDATLFQAIPEMYELKDRRQHDNRLHIEHNRWHALKRAYIYNNKVNPFKEWLEQLPEWDKVDRLTTLLADSLLIKNSGWNQQVGRLIINGIVKRQYEPGFPFEYVPIFIGERGLGKSTWVKEITNGKFFVKDIPLNSSEELFIRSITGAVVGETGNIIHKRITQRNRNIRWLIKGENFYKFPHTMQEETLKRRCIIIVTVTGTKQMELPPDETGYKKWLPVYCDEVDLYRCNIPKRRFGHITKWWSENRDQVFAQSLVECSGHTYLALDQGLEELQEIMCSTYTFARSINLTKEIKKILPKVFEERGKPVRTYKSERLPEHIGTVLTITTKDVREVLLANVEHPKFTKSNLRRISPILKAMGLSVRYKKDGEILWYKSPVIEKIAKK